MRSLVSSTACLIGLLCIVSVIDTRILVSAAKCSKKPPKGSHCVRQLHCEYSFDYKPPPGWTPPKAVGGNNEDDSINVRRDLELDSTGFKLSLCSLLDDEHQIELCEAGNATMTFMPGDDASTSAVKLGDVTSTSSAMSEADIDVTLVAKPNEILNETVDQTKNQHHTISVEKAIQISIAFANVNQPHCCRWSWDCYEHIKYKAKRHNGNDIEFPHHEDWDKAMCCVRQYRLSCSTFPPGHKYPLIPPPACS